jgi:hypothetical protein
MGNIIAMKRSNIARKPGKGMKRSWIRPKPKRGRKALIASADRLIQRLAIKRDFGRCQMCGYPGTEGHHIIHRRNHVLRWRLENIITLCHWCHSKDGTSCKGKLLEFCINWLGGQAEYDALRLEGNTGTSEEPGDAITRLQKELDF